MGPDKIYMNLWQRGSLFDTETKLWKSVFPYTGKKQSDINAPFLDPVAFSTGLPYKKIPFQKNENNIGVPF